MLYCNVLHLNIVSLLLPHKIFVRQQQQQQTATNCYKQQQLAAYLRCNSVIAAHFEVGMVAAAHKFFVLLLPLQADLNLNI